MHKLEPMFFARRTWEVAPELLGKVLVHDTPEGRLAGRIVEVESYYQDDPAAHSFAGRTERNKSLFSKPGTVYVYMSYGIHFCMNISVYKDGIGEGVLLRALEPLEGVELMLAKRGIQSQKIVSNGPGKLTQAMGVNKDFDGLSIFNSSLSVVTDQFSSRILPQDIVTTTRVGISKAKDAPLRFYLKNSPFVSKK